MLNGAGLLAAFLAGEKRAPNPMKDFTILARVARSRHIWAASSRSVFQSMEDVFREAERRSLIFATRGVGSSSFVDLTLTSHLLGIPVEMVAGYSGSRSALLAALRGEVDLVAYNFESILGHIENGDIKPLLQVSDEPIARHPALKETPVLGGPDGLATKRAHDLGREVLEVRADVTVLSALIGAGRLIVAPPGMEEGLCTCLKEALHRTLTADAFQAAMAAANLSLDIAPAETVEAEFRSISQRVEKFIPIIQDSISKARR